ncbi:MAG: hypothetical protein KF861_23290, partial [Planctomycetaceae bacterium]|nr:hypothetical protein [Planctomycetaceae bacterium]
GLAERTDALVIVVSEERGSVALAGDGALHDIENSAELEPLLHTFFERQSAHVPSRSRSDGRLRMLGPPLGSLVMAVALWFAFGFRIETIQRTIDDVPIELRNIPEGWVVENVSPNRVQLTLAGPERAIDALDPRALKASVNLAGIPEGQTASALREEHLNLPEGVRLRQADPPMFRFGMNQIATLTLPVRVRTQGRPPEGWTLDSVTPQPSSLVVRVPVRQRDRFDHLMTAPVDLSEMRGSASVTIPVEFPHAVQPSGDVARDVQVRIEMSRQPESVPTPENTGPAP